MRFTKASLARGVCHITFLTLAGLLIFGFNRSTQATITLDGTRYRITGPYSHENLSVLLLHAHEQDRRTFLTLEEGLKRGVVRVTEKTQEQVNELQIDNTGDDYLFLQEGDRVQGGKQDRTIYASFVVPPHSGPLPLPAFCVERSRWTAGAHGNQFVHTKSGALAPKEVRRAAKVQKDQGQVWLEVQNQKQLAAERALALNTNSSLNETLDAPKVQDSVAPFAAALNPVAEQHDDAVGVAIAINGDVEEINVYPNHRLFGQQYPRLLQAYGLQAVLDKDRPGPHPVLSAFGIERFIVRAEQDSKRRRRTPAADAAADVLMAQMMAWRHGQLGNLGGQFGAQGFNPFAFQGGQPGGQFGLQGVPVNNQFGNLGGQVGLQGGDPSRQLQMLMARSVPPGEWGPLAPADNQPGMGLPGGNLIPGAAEPRTLLDLPAPQYLRREETINADNCLEVVEAGGSCNCKTRYEGKLVHRQYISRGNPRP
jgi:hypothetical protein